MTTTTIEAGSSMNPTDSVRLNANDEVQQDTKGTFNYYGSLSAPPLDETQAVFNGTSSRLRKISANVYDLRRHDLAAYTIDRNGFEIVKHSSAALIPRTDESLNLNDSNLIPSRYWPELSQMLKAQLGVRAAVAISTTVRDVSVDNAVKWTADNPRANPKASLAPFFIVHCDYTPAGARGHMRGMQPSFFNDTCCEESISSGEQEEFFALRNEIFQAEDAAMLAEGISPSQDSWNWSGKGYSGPRWAMLSVWRPLETVYRDPLGILLGPIKSDSQPKDAERLAAPANANRSFDLPFVPFERMYKQRPGFAAEYKSANNLPLAPDTGSGEAHAWGYISEQRPDEVLLIKLFDSEADKSGSDVARWVGHSAFPLPGQDDKPLRRSVEVRFMIVW